MYEGWPEEATVTHFLGKPSRPGRVTVAAVTLLVAAALNLLVTGLYTTAGESASGNFLLHPVDNMSALPALVVGIATAVWLGVLALFLWRGKDAFLKPAKWTALAGTVTCGVFGTAAVPGVSTVTDSEGMLWTYAVLTLLDTAAYAVAGVALLGRVVKDYFKPRPEGRAPQVPQQVRPEDSNLPTLDPPTFSPPLFEPPRFEQPGGQPGGHQGGQQPGYGQPPQGPPGYGPRQ